MPHKMIEHIEQSPNGDDYREKLVAAEHGLRGDTVGITRIITMILALCWSLFQLASASILLLDTVYIRAIHLAFAISLVYFNIPMIKISGTSWRWDLRILLAMNRVTILDYLLGIIAAVSALYIVLDYEGIASRAGVPTTRDIIFGLMLVVLLLEATRRVIGPALPIIASIFILYVFTGPHLPDFLAFKGASLSRFISQMTMDTEGIYGVPLHVSATVVFLFVLFGTMLERAGGGNFFIQLAISGLGRFRGGAAKAAVLGSALTGVVSGSSIANVVTTGTFTIPLMKKVGYPPEKAAAVEVASSINPACHGRGGVHHRRIRQRPLHRSRQGGRHPGLRRLCGPALDHPRGSLQARAARPVQIRTAVFLDHAQRGAALPHPHLHVAV